MWSLAIYQPPQRSRYKRAVYVYGNNHTNGTFKDFDHFKVPSVVNIATFCHLCTRVNVAVSDGQGVLHYPRPLLARQLRFEANVTLRFLRQFVAASRRDAKKNNKKKTKRRPKCRVEVKQQHTTRSYYLPDTFVKIPLIFCPSSLSGRACHRVREFKSPGRIHDCTVSVIKRTPAGRGGGGEGSRHLFFQRETPGGCRRNGHQSRSAEAISVFRNNKEYPSV